MNLKVKIFYLDLFYRYNVFMVIISLCHEAIHELASGYVF